MQQRPTGQAKGTPHGKCKLCLQDKELCDSTAKVPGYQPGLFRFGEYPPAG